METKNAKPEEGSTGLTQARLRELIDYDPRTGVMRWRVSQGSAVAGTMAGRLNHAGYVRIEIDGRRYRRARLAFLYMTGRWPEPTADHRNGVKDDDRWSNLRDATHSDNSRNVRRRNKYGLPGITYRAGRRKPWRARIEVEGRRKCLGYFETKAEAAAAYKAVAERLYGTFAASKRRAAGHAYIPHADIRLGEQMAEIALSDAFTVEGV